MNGKNNDYNNSDIGENQYDNDTNKSRPKIIKSEDPYKSRKIIIYLCFAFIGLVNNLGYTLIITGAQQFSSKVNDDTLIAFYPFALIAFNSVARFINSKYLITLLTSIIFLLSNKTLFFHNGHRNRFQHSHLFLYLGI